MNSQISVIVKEYVDELKELLKDNIVEVYLFGSYAKNTHQEFSDVDLLVVVKKINLQLKKEISALSSQYSLNKDVVISPVIKEQEIWEKNKKYNTLFYNEVTKYGITV